MNTNVKYLGLDLKSPIIAGSSGLTFSVDNLRKLERAGAGAVVLKSVFEEQIIYDIKRNTHMFAPVGNYGESYEYIAQHVAADSLSKYFTLVRDAKEHLSIPVIGSINCFSHENWITYAKQFQEAGCDALELHMAIMPLETSLSADDVERTFSDIIQSLRKFITIPVSVKMGPYFTDLAKYLQQLSWMGIQGITLFNRAVQMDIDTQNMQYVCAEPFSYPGELYNTIRWTAVVSNKLRCDLSATTGVNSADDVVKLLLAGATTVQVASCLYRNGIEYMRDLNEGLQQWMKSHGFDSIDQFRGKLAMKSSDKPTMIQRTQFMNYFSDIK